MRQTLFIERLHVHEFVEKGGAQNTLLLLRKNSRPKFGPWSATRSLSRNTRFPHFATPNTIDKNFDVQDNKPFGYVLRNKRSLVRLSGTTKKLSSPVVLGFTTLGTCYIRFANFRWIKEKILCVFLGWSYKIARSILQENRHVGKPRCVYLW